MSKFTSHDNEKVVNIETNHGEINLSHRNHSKDNKSSNHLFALFGLLAFFGLLTFAIIYASSKRAAEPNNQNVIINSNINQNNTANGNVNNAANNPNTEKKPNSIPKEKDSKTIKTNPLTINRDTKKKTANKTNNDFTPSDCSGTSNGCQ